jgi:hypothetical protein
LAGVRVSDRDSMLTARLATAREGILMGESCGTTLWAALQVAREERDPSALFVVLLGSCDKSKPLEITLSRPLSEPERKPVLGATSQERFQFAMPGPAMAKASIIEFYMGRLCQKTLNSSGHL